MEAVLFVDWVLVRRRGGESGGVIGESCKISCPRRLAADWDWRTPEGMDIGIGYAQDGGRYVIPIALCRPDTSSFAGTSAIVASPGIDPGIAPGMRNLITALGFLSEKAGSA